MTASRPQLKLFHYFGIEGLNTFGGILFLYCVFFWTKLKFGYSDRDNLLLTATHGLFYIFATKYGGKLSDRIGYDLMLRICTLGLALTLLLGWIPGWRGSPFLIIALYTLFIGPIWPTLEAAILHSPGSATMPNRLGLYNITWAFGDGLGFGASGFLIIWKPDSVLWIPGLLFLIQWAWLKLAPRNSESEGSAAMEMPHSGNLVKRSDKQRFMHAAWLANGLGFLMLVSIFALAPYIGQQLGLPPEYTIWLASTLLFARGVAFVIFWKWEGWQYRNSWSQWALWLAPASLAFVFFSREPIVVFAALVLFGMAIGLSYSASLYYSLDYGENKGEHGGIHESILGIGMFIGPLAAALVSSFGGGTSGAEWSTIGLTVLCNILGLYWIARIGRTSRRIPT